MKKIRWLSIPLILMTLGLEIRVNAAEVQSYNSQGIVGFGPGSGVQPPVNPNKPDPTLPVFPQNPDGSKPNPGGNGSLTIDFASSFDFGNHKISNKDQTYLAKAQKYFDSEVLTPNYVQVTDRRGTFAGWNLKVVEKTQVTQIDSGPQKYKVLKGATINLKSSETASFTNEKSPKTQTLSGLIPGVETQVALASTGEGAGTWVIRWGNDSMVTEDGLTTAVSLFVPGDTPKDATAYTTTLNWILSDLPTNAPN